MGLRIIAGSARGRKLRAPAGSSVRPTSDRVREAVFNSLGSLDLIRGANVLDLFAGSGALGIEALSRGAAHVTFVDSSVDAIEVITDNLKACGFVGSSAVVRSDAVRYLRTNPGVFDLALLDPPYEFDKWKDLLTELDSAALVAESDRELGAETLGAGDSEGARMEVLRVRRYGGTVVTISVRKRREQRGADLSEESK